MRAYCIDRLIDPKKHRAIAAYGWIQERPEWQPRYWVSIDNHPPEFFWNEATAKLFYDVSIEPLRIGLLMRNIDVRNQTLRSTVAGADR